MTEDEAKKILDWLCMRWAKNIQHLYKTEKSMDMVVKMSDDKYFIRYDNALELVFDAVFFFGANKGMEFENVLHYNSRLIYEDDQLLLKILKVKSIADFLEYAFNKNNIWVEGWGGCGVNFIDAGESLEEIKVKMDLEDFDD